METVFRSAGIASISNCKDDCSRHTRRYEHNRWKKKWNAYNKSQTKKRKEEQKNENVDTLENLHTNNNIWYPFKTCAMGHTLCHAKHSCSWFWPKTRIVKTHFLAWRVYCLLFCCCCCCFVYPFVLGFWLLVCSWFCWIPIKYRSDPE